MGMYDKFSQALPETIEGAIEAPKIFEMQKAAGPKAVQEALEFELIRLASLMSVGGNLNRAQVPFIAKQLIAMYPKESIADFKVCFERGAMGLYGQIQRMDGITLKEWFDKYLEEKYQIIEDRLMDEKDDMYKPLMPESSQHVKDFDFDSWLEAVKNIETKAVRSMTKEEIEKEGQARRGGPAYNYTVSEGEQRARDYYKRLFESQDATVRDRHPDWSEEQITKRCTELKHEATKHLDRQSKQKLGL